MALSEFQKKKITKAFNSFDASKDGVVELSDLEQIAEKIAQNLSVKLGSPEHDKIKAAWQSIWDCYFKPADVDGSNTVNLEEYLKANERFLSSPNASTMGTDLNKVLYDTIDLDGGGSIDEREFVLFSTATGISEADAKIAFSHLDTDKSGSITREEFAKNAYDYFYSEDPQSPANWFFGSLD